jgi:hypothetical protein
MHGNGDRSSTTPNDPEVFSPRLIDPQNATLTAIKPSISACGFALLAYGTRETASGNTTRMTKFTYLPRTNSHDKTSLYMPIVDM